MKGRPTINIPTSANPSSQSLRLPQQDVIKKPNGDHVKHLVGRARQARPVTGHRCLVPMPQAPMSGST